jgi:thiol-disulfide isomerase/thioredoxin
MTEQHPTQAMAEVESATPAPAVTRRWGLAAMAAAAAAAGAGVAWWRLQPGKADLTGFWGLSFPTPDGTTLTMASLRGKPLLVNFWATWCPPCIEELPLLSRFYEANWASGWQLVGLAVDQPDPVKRFLDRTPVAFPVAMAGLAGVDLSKQLGNDAGGLPFTVVFDAEGTLRHRKIGQVHEADLKAWRG